MSFVDRTNETISLHMKRHRHDNGPGALFVDVDADSSIHPAPWLVMLLHDDTHDGEPITLTMEEAEQLHDRLSRILAKGLYAPKGQNRDEEVREVVRIYQREWEEYNRVANTLDHSDPESQFRFRLARAFVNAGYAKEAA